MILQGDCVEVMAGMAENSVDAICTDPPYGLEFMGKEWDKLEPNRSRFKGKPRKMIAPAEFKDFKALPSFGSQSRNPRCENCGKFRWDHVGRKRSCETPSFRHAHMGNEQQAWHLRWATEALRVLKPGGHLLAFGGSRTYHRLVCAVEDAGFEIRDTLSWMYGSGFPKSLDVSKSIDRTRDDYEATCTVALWLRPHVERVGFDTVTRTFGFKDETMARARWTSRSQPQVPSWEQWERLKLLCEFGNEMDAEVWRLNGRKGKPGENWDKREITGHHEGHVYGEWVTNYGIKHHNTPLPKRDNPATDAAKQWDGWGTSLKPAVEYIVLARKPLSEKNVAANVLRWNTGALNIDACRVVGESWDTEQSLCDSCAGRADRSEKLTAPATKASIATKPVVRTTNGRVKPHPSGTGKTDTGCFAGLSLEAPSASRSGDTFLSTDKFGSDTTAHRFPPDTSSTTSTATERTTESRTCSSCGEVLTPGYISKGSPSGRWPSNVILGCACENLREGDHAPDCAVRMLDEQSGELTSGKPAGRRYATGYGGGLGDGKTALTGYGDTGYASRFFYTAKASRAEREAQSKYFTGVKSDHPTVKPVDLMRWLIRLVTPPGGVVLDPFLGSGTTAVAAILEQVECIGIERDPDYVKIATMRVEEAMPLFTRATR